MAAYGQVELRELQRSWLTRPQRLRCAHLARLEKLIPELVA